MKKYYHMAPLSKVRSISNLGLTPQNGDNSKVINDEKKRVFFSEGMTGTVALYADFQKHYDQIKSGNVGKTPEDRVKAIQASNSLEEYLGGEGVYFIFDGTNIENEKNFMDGCTTQTILPQDLQVCLLKNNDTNEVSYSRYDIIKYMMGKVPIETINYSGKDIGSENVSKVTSEIQSDVNNYYKKHEKEINPFKYGNYTMESISVKEFCENYLSNKESNLTGQNVGKDTMNLLEDVEAVLAMEAILDRDVREIEIELEQSSKQKEAEKVRVKKDNQ